MDRVEYLVCQRGGRWTLIHDGREAGRYDSREVAISVGIDAANGAGLQGAEAMVREEVPNGAPRTLWTYGRDPYRGPLKERSSPEFS